MKMGGSSSHSSNNLALNASTLRSNSAFETLSALVKTGRDEILDYIEQQNAEVANLMNRK